MPIDQYFDVAFAVDGDLTTVPDGVQVNGSVSYTQGYGPYYAQDPTIFPSTALFIDRAQFNQLLNDITTALQQYQQFSCPPFITSAMNGGSAFTYPAYVQVLQGGVRYQSLVAGNADTPPSAKWGVVSGVGGIPNNSQTGEANYAPTAADQGKIITRSNGGGAMADTLPGTSGALAASWFAYVENTDATASDSFGVGSGGSISVGTQSAANAFIIAPGETWFVISLGSGNYIAERIGAGTLHTKPPQGHYKNLAGVWASNTTATFTADSIVLYDANANSKIITTFNETVSVSSTGAGGLDAGSVAANTWYGVYAINNAATNVKNIIASTSFTAPTLPTGYTYGALIGAFLTDGSSHIIGFKQFGNQAQWVVGDNLSGIRQMASGGTSGVTAVATGNFVPPNASVIKCTLSVGDANTVQVGPNSVGSNSFATCEGAPVTSTTEMLLETSNIYWSSSSSAAYVACVGYTMNL